MKELTKDEMLELEGGMTVYLNGKRLVFADIYDYAKFKYDYLKGPYTGQSPDDFN